jgi:hypothetical protein
MKYDQADDKCASYPDWDGARLHDDRPQKTRGRNDPLGETTAISGNNSEESVPLHK